MATDVTMPRLSDSMEEGTILSWIVDEGDEVKRGEPLVEIETDKANMTYEADTDGTLIEIVAGEGETLADIAGLGARAPVLAFGLTVALLSLAGLPPLGGFVAKFAMFSATIERGTAGGGTTFYALAAAGVLNTVVSVYYYARVAKVMYFDPAPRGARTPLEVPRMHTALISISAGVVVALGIYVSPLASLVSRSAALWSGR